MKILHVTPSYYPSTHWGGPIYSVHGLCSALAKIPGVELRVLTTDTAGPRLSDRLKLTSFPTHFPDGHDVYYCRRLLGASFSPGLLGRLWSMIKWADVVHLTAVYSTPTLPTLMLAKLLQKPVVWSPRGSLQRWEGSTSQRAKLLYDRISNSFCDRQRVVLHLTSEAEKTESQQRIFKAQCVLVHNGIDAITFDTRHVANKEAELRLLFIGRLHPIKGIENLLKAISKTRIPVRLDICGNGETEYCHRLEKLTTDLGLANRVRFNGFVTAESKERRFREADVCIVPSYKENFCMVIAESLNHGVPVIVSRGTPWNLVEDNGCGLWVDNDPESLACAIEKISTMPLTEMGNRGKRWIERDFSWDRQAQKMLACYKALRDISLPHENPILAKS